MVQLLEIPFEIFYCFRDFLCYVDFQSFRLTCKTISTIPQKDFKKILIQKLKLHTDEPEKLLDSIDQAGGCISGSFILAALYDQNFYHDIDIYENPNIAIPQDLYNMNYLHKICKICKYMRHSFDCDHDYWYSGNMFNELNYKIRSFLPAEYGNGYYLPFDFLIVSNHGIFQHMAIPFHIPTFIAKSFDLDLCKNMYYQGKLFVKSWNILISRQDSIKLPGIISINHKHHNSTIRGINENLEKRKEKYIQRGFNIAYNEKNDYFLEILNNSPLIDKSNRCHHKNSQLLMQY